MSTDGIDSPTSRNYNNDLRLLLQKLGLKPPYILVGHSFGGLNIQLFAAEYPDEVAGMVLVDSVHEQRYSFDQFDSHRKNNYNKALKQYQLGYILSPLGLPRLLKMYIGTKRLPMETQQIIKALGYRNNAYKAVYRELLHAPESAKQLRNNNIKADLPITILSAGKQDEEWKKQQSELLKLSGNTKQVVIEDSWHSIHIHEPKAVIDAIKEIINYWR